TGCPNCRRPVSDDFMVCAYCGTALKAPCNSCGRLLQFSWRVCPTCATPKPRPQPDPAEVARQREAQTAQASAGARRRTAPGQQSAPRSEPRASSNGNGTRATGGTTARTPRTAPASEEQAAPVRPRGVRRVEEE